MAIFRDFTLQEACPSKAINGILIKAKFEDSVAKSAQRNSKLK